MTRWTLMQQNIILETRWGKVAHPSPCPPRPPTNPHSVLAWNLHQIQQKNAEEEEKKSSLSQQEFSGCRSTEGFTDFNLKTRRSLSRVCVCVCVKEPLKALAFLNCCINSSGVFLSVDPGLVFQRFEQTWWTVLSRCGRLEIETFSKILLKFSPSLLVRPFFPVS